MGPYEFAALAMVLPMVVAMVWIARRFETDGAPALEFEAWCRATRPVVFALQCATGRAASVASVVAVALGPRLQVEHHRGRYPWTRYLFEVELELDPMNDVVLGRVKACAMRRGMQRRPELGMTLDRVTAGLAESLQAFWVHAELREDDDAAGLDRRERGWIAPIDQGARGAFAPTVGLPGWARVPRAALA